MSKHKDDSHDFKPLLVEIQEKPMHPFGRIIFWVIVAFIVFGILWMFIGEIDVVVSARGKIIPEGDIKIIQPLETGVIKQIFIKEGDYVKKNQKLVEIDTSTTEPALDSLEENLIHLELEAIRLDSTSDNKKDFSVDQEAIKQLELLQIQQEMMKNSLNSLSNQLSAKNKESKQIDVQILTTNDEINTVKKLLSILQDRDKRLNDVADLVAKDEIDEVKSKILNYKSNLEELQHKLNELSYKKGQIQSESGYLTQNFKYSTLKELSENQKQIAELKARIEQVKFQNVKQTIVSPVDGYINTLLIHTIGGVVSPAEKILSIVPKDNPLVIKATVLNKDIGFVEKGMEVQVKVDTFSFQKYGLIQGEVEKVSKDSIQDEKLGEVYEVYIRPLNHSLVVEGKDANISTGMTVNAEIKTGKRKIIEFFIYPLIKYWNEGISVR